MNIFNNNQGNSNPQPGQVPNQNDVSDLVSQLQSTSPQVNEAELKRLEEEKRQSAEKAAKKEIIKDLKGQIWSIDKGTKRLLANLFLAICICISTYVAYSVTFPMLKQNEIVKMDTVKIEKDINVIKKNILLYDETTPDAFSYRRLNDLLEQAIPNGDKYEDNIVVILNMLKESVTEFSKNTKYMRTLSLQPDVNLADLRYFQVDGEKLLAIEYTLKVDNFEKYEYLKNFLSQIEDRLRIFHISDINITKVLNRETKKPEYSISLKMVSYYKMPEVDENGVRVQATNIDKPFN